MTLDKIDALHSLKKEATTLVLGRNVYDSLCKSFQPITNPPTQTLTNISSVYTNAGKLDIKIVDEDNKVELI